MTNSDLVAIECDDTNGEPDQITRAVDLSTTTCVEVEGGDVVFCPVVERTADGGALAHTGEDIPVMTTSVYSERELRGALQEAGYDGEYIDSALRLTVEGERGRQVARLAESQTHEHPAQAGAGDHDDPRDFRGTGFGGENPRTLATDGGTRASLADAEPERPAIVDLPDDPHRVRCEGCGDTGVKDLDGGPVILHEKTCPHAEDSR